MANQASRTIWSFHIWAKDAGGRVQDLLAEGFLPGAEQPWILEAGFCHFRAEVGDGACLYHFGVSLEAGQSVMWTLLDS